MTKKEKKYVAENVENEGFDYAFTFYSQFDGVKDKRFHELRKAFLEARKALAEYIGVDET